MYVFCICIFSIIFDLLNYAMKNVFITLKLGVSAWLSPGDQLWTIGDQKSGSSECRFVIFPDCSAYTRSILKSLLCYLYNQKY